MMKILAVLLIGWLLSVPPKGHLETVTNADGKIYAYSTTTVSNLLGTAHNGGSNQIEADSRGIVYTIYGWRDINRNSAADAGDEPIGSTTLSGGINDSITTMTLTSATFFLESGFIKIGSEVIKYTGKTGSSLTGCTRGYNESSTAAHLDGAAVAALQVWENLLTVTCDGSPYSVLGWDAGQGNDDGTEGDLLQSGTVTVSEGQYWLWKIRVVDLNGNTNNEVVSVDVFATYSTNAYVGANGDAALGLEDNEVWQFRINKRPGAR